ncbi:MAG: nucleotide-binding domain containing protein [Lacunisphaera sp.]
MEIVASLPERPRWLVAKGGITSSDLATQALGVRRALVLGQALPGVPVWQLGAESRWPGLNYVVFPGNVGGDDALERLVAMLEEAGGSGTDAPEAGNGASDS